MIFDIGFNVFTTGGWQIKRQALLLRKGLAE
jgi:hypothetical protein